MDWLTPTLQVFLAVAGLALVVAALFLAWVISRYLHILIRIFEEKPLFIVPRGDPIPGAEEVRFPTRDGLMLAGSYLRSTAPKRRGVVIFGPEFGSNRWSCNSYCAHLLTEGYDLFTFDFRGHGDSDKQPGHEPMMWVTNLEERDFGAAVEYLKTRPDADARGIGAFGVSRGGGAALLVAAKSPYVRCVVTDGAFATRTTMIPYMRKWIDLYCSRWRMQRWFPDWAYALVAHVCLWFQSRRRHCKFPSLQRAVAKLAPRPLLVIHGANDTYIKPEIARRLYDVAAGPKEFWLVENAKHNQAIQVAGDEYRRRLSTFFHKHLDEAPAAAPDRQPLTAAAGG